MQTIKKGDFTLLAENYSKHRPEYSPAILDVILGILSVQSEIIKAVDVGSGTGIFARMLAARGCIVTAIEPNSEMLEFGKINSNNYNVNWQKASAESTGLPDDTYDIVTMASAFHWTEFDKAVKEFNRILRTGGIFAPLWNTRLIEINPLLVDIENHLKAIVPDLKRVSSGRSEFCENLTYRLIECGFFKDVIYLEARHVEHQSPERYIGLWRSVNDIQVQAGPKRFEEFVRYIETKIDGLDTIEATYLTRAWLAKK